MKNATEQAEANRRTIFTNREFLMNNLTDPTLAEGFMKQSLYRTRRLAIILGAILIIALEAVVFSFVQRTKAEDIKREAKSNEEQLAVCQTELERQKGTAAEALLIAEETLKVVQDQLEECLRKK